MHQRQLGGLWAAFVSAIVGTIVITACGGGGGGSDTEHREMPSARGGGGNGGGGGGGGSSAGVALTADARVRSGVAISSPPSRGPREELLCPPPRRVQ